MQPSRSFAFAILPLTLAALSQLDCSASPSTGSGGASSTTSSDSSSTSASTTVGPATTGSSTGTCGSMGCCVNDVCPEVLVDKLDAVAGLLEQDKDLFYLGSVHKVPKSGGAPVEVVAGLTGSFAVDATNIYWIDGSATSLWKANLDGTAAATIGSLDGFQYPHTMVLDDTDIYYTSLVTKPMGDCTAVMRKPKAGGPAVEAAEACDFANPSKPYAIALNATDVFWSTIASNGGGSLYHAPKAGNAAAGMGIVFSKSSPVTRIAVDGTRIYYLQNGVIQLDLPNPAGATHVSTVMKSIQSFTIDATSIYLVGAGGVTKVDRASQKETQLAYDTGASIVVDDTSVYWGGGLMGMAKILKIAK